MYYSGQSVQFSVENNREKLPDYRRKIKVTNKIMNLNNNKIDFFNWAETLKLDTDNHKTEDRQQSQKSRASKYNNSIEINFLMDDDYDRKISYFAITAEIYLW